MTGGKPKRVRKARKEAIVNRGATNVIGAPGVGRPVMLRRHILSNAQRRTFRSLYNLPIFTTLLNDPNVSTGQLNMIKRLSNMNFVNSIEPYRYNANTPYSIVHIRQSDFANGTVRITKPGIYVLKEDIVFHPNPGDDFQPLAKDIVSGKYPIPGPFQLGFFAAVTIEARDVILDLNGHSIKQSLEHFLQQRFYATIELGSSPFISNQGPSMGITGDYKAPCIITVMNGKLGLSSHHGIHGNKKPDEHSNILLYKLLIEDFQVAGIALNGASNSVLCDLEVRNTNGAAASNQSVPINFQY